MRVIQRFALAALILSAPRIARADTGVDTILLTNGGRVRGTVVVDDSTGVRIQLADGTTRILKRRDVKNVEYADETSPVAVAPAASAPATTPSPAMAVPPLASTRPLPPPSGRGVLVVMDSNRDVQLERAPGGGVAEWTPVCEGVCGQVLDPVASYRITGPGVRRSRTFTLAEAGSATTLHVRAGSRAAYGAGIGLYIPGVLALATGAISLAVLEGMSANESIQPSAFVNSGVVVGVGFALALPGLILMLTSRTRVTLDAGPRLAERRWLHPWAFSF